MGEERQIIFAMPVDLIALLCVITTVYAVEGKLNDRSFICVCVSMSYVCAMGMRSRTRSGGLSQDTVLNMLRIADMVCHIICPYDYTIRIIFLIGLCLVYQ